MFQVSGQGESEECVCGAAKTYECHTVAVEFRLALTVGCEQDHRAFLCGGGLFPLPYDQDALVRQDFQGSTSVVLTCDLDDGHGSVPIGPVPGPIV